MFCVTLMALLDGPLRGVAQGVLHKKSLHFPKRLAGTIFKVSREPIEEALAYWDGDAMKPQDATLPTC